MQNLLANHKSDRNNRNSKSSRVPPPDSYVLRHLAEKILVSRPVLEGERKQAGRWPMRIVDYSAFAHTTHLAARMQEHAAGKTTSMTSTTLRQVEEFVQVKSVGAAQVKCVSQPVEGVVAATTSRTLYRPPPHVD